jgi:O-Antigen ligase
MSLSLVALGTPGGVPAELSAELGERRIRRRVGIVWGLLVLNALTFYPGFPLVVPIPHRIGQVITQGALPLALVVALTVNRRVIVRPNVFLCLVSLLVLDAVLTSLQVGHLGPIYRTVRLAEFIAALWLLSPWWGRRDMLLLRCHIGALSVLVGSTLLGLLVHPGGAMAGGRLTDVFWPIPATEVAHYGAVLAGLVVVLWLGGLVPGRVTLLVAAVSMGAILLSHTRTALAGMVAGILVAGLSLYAARGRVRKFFAAAAVMVSVVVMTAASVVTRWLARGESSQELASLTGRTNFWEIVVHMPRNKFQEIMGFGLSNTSVNGLPIDSNWLAAYMQQGLLGVIVGASMLLFLFVVAFFQPPGVRRALALFLITYTLVASFTQVGFANATTYLLELTLAASLLVPLAATRQPE